MNEALRKEESSAPLLANLFLHYAFDLWMGRNWSHLPFERYADDIIVHCRTEREANLVRVKMAARLKQCGLELHPEKTKVVYCKDANRQGTHPNEKFDFLGFTLRPRKAAGRKGKIFCSFSPAISKKAGQKIRDEIRGWKLHRCTGQPLHELARKINTKLRGWFNYSGRFTPSALRPIESHVGQSLVRWACRKYKKLRNHRSRAWAWLMQVIDRQPNLLALWEHQPYSSGRASGCDSPRTSSREPNETLGPAAAAIEEFRLNCRRATRAAAVSGSLG